MTTIATLEALRQAEKDARERGQTDEKWVPKVGPLVVVKPPEKP